MKRDEAGAGDGGRTEVPGAVARAIGQTRPFRSTSQEAMLGILLSAERLRQRMAALLEPWGITLQQYNVLRILRGVHPDPLPTLEVAARMVEKTPGVTRLIDRLEEKSWVSRERCRTDRRQVHCRITPAGLALLAETEADVNRLDDAMEATFSEKELRGLIGMLDRVIEPAD